MNMHAPPDFSAQHPQRHAREDRAFEQPPRNQFSGTRNNPMSREESTPDRRTHRPIAPNEQPRNRQDTKQAHWNVANEEQRAEQIQHQRGFSQAHILDQDWQQPKNAEIRNRAADDNFQTNPRSL